MRVDILKIRSIDITTRRFEGESLSTGTRYVNVMIASPVNDISLPKIFDESGMENLGEGQLALVLFDNDERPFCIGFLETNFKQKLEKFLERKVRPGEKCIKGPVDQELYFDRHGNFRLTSVEDGFKYEAETRGMTFSSYFSRFIHGGLEVIKGFVRRGLMVFLELNEIAHEFTVRLKRVLSGFKVIEFSLGDIYDDNGNREMGLAERARALIRVFNDAGLNVAEATIDVMGNIKFKFFDIKGEFMNAELDGVEVKLKVTSFSIGKGANQEPVILGRTFYNLFKNHVHSTPVGPTTPPTVVLPDDVVFSKVTKTE